MAFLWENTAGAVVKKVAALKPVAMLTVLATKVAARALEAIVIKKTATDSVTAIMEAALVLLVTVIRHFVPI